MTTGRRALDESHDQVSELSRRFRSHLDSGDSPQVNDYLDEVAPSLRAALLRALIVHQAEAGSAHAAASPMSGGFNVPVHDTADDDASRTLSETILDRRFTFLNDPVPADSPVPEFAAGPLACLPCEMQWEIRHQMKQGTFSCGDAIIAEGDRGDCLYVLTDGLAEVSMSHDSGGQQWIGMIAKGQVIGEMALMGVEKRTARVVAREPVSVLILDRRSFSRLLGAHQDFAALVTTIIADRLGNRDLDALSQMTLAGYTIQSRLGRGGMSVVYDAVQQAAHRRVALKMMSHRLCFDDMARQWFSHEAETILSFDHPHIPKCFDRFDAFATSFIAIEYIDGASLNELLKREGLFDEESVLTVLGCLASALSYAHAGGIVHRDVKPSNCMVTNDGRVMLMDFGLSVPYFGGPARDEAIAGTPAYMAPEQFFGEIRPESDWFSLGCVGYELLTGARLLNPESFDMLVETYRDWDVHKVTEGLRTPFPRASQFLESFLHPDPAERAAAISEVLEYCRPLPRGSRTSSTARGH